MNKEELLSHIDKFHTTKLGIERIKRNIQLDNDCYIYKKGKNWYCEIRNIKITINSYSYTIITAHKIK